MKILALDAHAASFTLEVMTPGGQVAKRLSREMSARNLIDVVQEVTGPKTLVVEESHLAQWVKRTLEPYVDKLLICDPQRNAWIAKDQFNDDESSAHKLALLHRGGFLKEIRHPDEKGEYLRSLFLQYYDLTQQLTRFKCKLKAAFRQEAIPTSGRGIYEEEQHEKWLRLLRPQKHLQHSARQSFEVIDLLAGLKEQTYKVMTQAARGQKAFELLQTIPGVGPVIATGYLALIETPHRFSCKNKLWNYAGLANTRHTSAEVVYEEHASQYGNRALKWVVIENFLHAVERPKNSNRFQRQYQSLRGKGLDDTAARRNVCRALLSTVRAMWMKEETYREDPLKKEG
jgi:transposase